MELENIANKYMLDERKRPPLNMLVEVPTADVLAIINGEERNIQLDLVGTDFQIRVWQAIQKIPRGTTVTYEELAKTIGMPQGMRAVAQACGLNPIAVVIPCHRVVGKKDMGGYRWGEERKRELLRREGITL